MNPLGSSELSLTFLIACSMKATILLSFAWIAASAGFRSGSRHAAAGCRSESAVRLRV